MDDEERRRCIACERPYLHYDAPAFLCSKLVYKSLAYIFNGVTPKVAKRISRGIFA